MATPPESRLRRRYTSTTVDTLQQILKEEFKADTEVLYFKVIVLRPFGISELESPPAKQ